MLEDCVTTEPLNLAEGGGGGGPPGGGPWASAETPIASPKTRVMMDENEFIVLLLALI